jgi:hypothetical protein
MVQKHGNQIQLLEENFKLSSTGVLEKILYIQWPEKRRAEELQEHAGEEPVETQIKRRKWR